MLVTGRNFSRYRKHQNTELFFCSADSYVFTPILFQNATQAQVSRVHTKLIEFQTEHEQLQLELLRIDEEIQPAEDLLDSMQEENDSLRRLMESFFRESQKLRKQTGESPKHLKIDDAISLTTLSESPKGNNSFDFVAQNLEPKPPIATTVY